MLTQLETAVVKDDIALEEIEKLLSDENILENPRLLDMMDDNLSISIADFCMYHKMNKNTVLKEHHLIEELSRSNIFIFDRSKGEIQRREKGLRRIILFQEVNPGLSLKNFLKENCLMDSVLKYEDSNKDFIKIYFNTEEETLDVIKKIEKIKWENNLEFRCQIKCESFKSNISNQLLEKESPNEPQNFSLKNEIHIVLDKEKYTPRKLEPDSYSKNLLNMNNSYRNQSFAMNSLKNFKGSKQYNQDYISNSTKESLEDDLNNKKFENKKVFRHVYEKMRSNGSLMMPYVMKKYFNPLIMEKKFSTLKEKREESKNELENYAQNNRKWRMKDVYN